MEIGGSRWRKNLLSNVSALNVDGHMNYPFSGPGEEFQGFFALHAKEGINPLGAMNGCGYLSERNNVFALPEV